MKCNNYRKIEYRKTVILRMKHLFSIINSIFNENLINLKIVKLNNYARLIEQILNYIKIMNKVLQIISSFGV